MFCYIFTGYKARYAYPYFIYQLRECLYRLCISLQKLFPTCSTSQRYTCTYSNLKEGFSLVVYLNDQQVLASFNCSVVSCKKIIMYTTPLVNPPDNTEDNTKNPSVQPVAQLSASLSAEDVQQIANAVAVSNNPWYLVQHKSPSYLPQVRNC